MNTRRRFFLLGLFSPLFVTLYFDSDARAENIPGICTSDNAPGTPKGASCRCEATGPGAICVTVGTGGLGVAICKNNAGDGEICQWMDGLGCICTNVSLLWHEQNLIPGTGPILPPRGNPLGPTDGDA